MENKELSIKLNEDKLKIAEIKNKNTAKNKIIYAIFSTIATVFATIYSDEKQLVVLSILLFTFPSYIESLGISNKNVVVKCIIKIYKIIFIILTILLLVILIWFMYNKNDAYQYTELFLDYILYSSIFVNILFSLISYFNLQYNINEHIALVVIEESTLEKQKERLKFKDSIQKEHKKAYREFVGNTSSKDKRGKNK
ncbi:hypothetical protein [Staphylococcus warneri]|uniref:hypothetical protein n=1 Tax=Staphylococcus warneri TaxID=1292 RepID=UPI001038F5A6|nr:hypothetical protein [Staphylococcus warneri]MDK4265627.1 hypothetical protein [Staphylococcus warneri]TBW79717.1 hypothetical protein EQ810_10740 [Staphylococcus warneri]